MVDLATKMLISRHMCAGEVDLGVRAERTVGRDWGHTIRFLRAFSATQYPSVKPSALFAAPPHPLCRLPGSQVRDRLLAVERHREALIAALRDGAGGAAALTTPSGREFAARFRPMAEEAVLAECKAVHGKRVGQLYLTFK